MYASLARSFLVLGTDGFPHDVAAAPAYVCVDRYASLITSRNEMLRAGFWQGVESASRSVIGKIRLDLRLVPTDPSIVGIVLCSLDMMSLSLRRALATSNTNVLSVVTFKIRSSRSSYPGPSVRQAPRRVVNTNEDFVDKTHALSQNLKSSTFNPGILCSSAGSVQLHDKRVCIMPAISWTIRP